jgi:hypothetical protein
MAQMPRGQARSVFAQIRDAADEMVEQERRKRERAQELQRLAARSAAGFDHTGLLNYDPRRDITPADRPSVVRPAPSLLSAAELEAQRRGVHRVAFMTGNTLGAGAYGIASAMGAPHGVRDGALAVGGLLDAGMLGAAPLGLTVRPQPAPSPTRALLPIRRNPVRQLDAKGQSMGFRGAIPPEELPGGTRANRRVEPTGLLANPRKNNQARGHYRAKSLGGSGDTDRDLFTITQSPTNNKHMWSLEREVLKRVRSGEVVDYSVTPFYGPGVGAPEWLLMTADGPRGGPAARLIQNPAARQRK